MKYLYSVILVFFVVLSMIGCGSSGNATDADAKGTSKDAVTEDGQIGKDIEGDGLTQEQIYLMSDKYASDVDESLTGANTQFAVRLFKELNKGEGPDKNLFVSPLSVSMALAMIYNGATGDTKQAMAETLEYSGIDIDKLNTGFLNLINSLENVDIDLVLAIANSIWMDDQFEPSVNKDFLDTMKEFFESDLFTIDFQAVDAYKEINAWIEDNTNGKIKDVLSEIPAGVIMYLINALYFKANWTYPFDKEETSKQEFTLANGTKKNVDMMIFPKMVSSFKFVADENYCVVRLPYGRDKVAFYGFIPYGYPPAKTVEDFITDLTAEKLNQYFNTVAYPEGEGNGIVIWLPKFKIEYKKTLNDVLEALGMGPAFVGGFDDIAQGIAISRVIHQTFVEVNEEGTEAAATTVVEVFSGITPNFIGTRPFFFVIRDDRSGSILFIGKVADPVYE